MPEDKRQKTEKGLSSSAARNLATLRRRREFVALAEKGRKWVAPGLILQAGSGGRDKTSPPIRYGLTASGKIGNAVKRNRARRRLRALAFDVLPKHAASGHDYVLIARASTITRAFADLRGDLVEALKKLGVWRDG